MNSAAANYAEQAPQSLNVLIVEDDKDMVLTISALLRDEGHIVSHAYAGKTALEMCGHLKPDVMLVDIGLPDMTGYDIARAVRTERGESVVLIAVTAWARTPDKIAAQIAGFDHHLAKPFDPNALAALLRTNRSGESVGIGRTTLSFLVGRAPRRGRRFGSHVKCA